MNIASTGTAAGMLLMAIDSLALAEENRCSAAASIGAANLQSTLLVLQHGPETYAWNIRLEHTPGTYAQAGASRLS